MLHILTLIFEREHYKKILAIGFVSVSFKSQSGTKQETWIHNCAVMEGASTWEVTFVLFQQ